ncbi:MAG TPA: zinc ribbon domain-containing protein [Anaerolineales bacterium]|nr:zinc ribbon domain-containing protein [Anaerolineales bacterium]
MKKTAWLIVAVLLFSLILTPGAGAQTEVTLEEANIALWPEYDRTGVLVIYRLKLSPTVALPAALAFNIPAAAGEPNAVAEAGLDGNLYSLAYDREVHGERAVILMTASMPEIQLEYYDPALRVEGDQRDYNYTWMGDYAVDQLSFEVQEPMYAKNITIDPDLGASESRRDGLSYYTAEKGSLGQGENFDLNLSYQKDTNLLSVEVGTGFYPEPSDVISQETIGRVNLNDGLRWLAGIFVLLLLAGGIFWLVRIRNNDKMARAATGVKRGRRGAAGPEQQVVAQGPYCHQCGKLAASGDLFCRACGTRLRFEDK